MKEQINGWEGKRELWNKLVVQDLEAVKNYLRNRKHTIKSSSFPTFTV